MRVIIGNTYYPTIEGSSVQITRVVTDPVSTCTVNLIDNTSSLNPQCPQELLVLDDQKVANTAINMLLNPTFNPYSSTWVVGAGTGFAASQQSGGGIIWTMSNWAFGNGVLTEQTVCYGTVSAGQTYMVSIDVVGGSSPTNIGAGIGIVWLNARGVSVGSNPTQLGPVPISTSPAQYTLSATAPAGAIAAQMQLILQVSSSTNSGTITWTNAQFEPEWFPTVTYPTPFCGPAQTNCQQLPLGFWIRQYRKFAGLVTHTVAMNYHGNVRTLQIDAVGYAWLTGTILANDSFTSQADSAIITSLVNKYLTTNALLPLSISGNLVSTANVVTGVTVSSVQSNWDDLRTNIDSLAGLAGFFWTIDAYWNLIYAPPGYNTMPISLICDESSIPDEVTTFPAYNFSAEQDFTQPGSTILVMGNGTNVSEVIDPAQTAQLGQLNGYYLPVGTSWMRKVNDSTLASTTDTTNRGLAELVEYDTPRTLYHLTTNVELIPGQGIAITSATEGLNQSTQLIQQTTAQWIGTDGTLKDVWKYQSDLGAVNRHATNMLSRIFRLTQTGTSAPAIAVTTLAAFERVNVVESLANGTTVSNYAQTILPDGPAGLWPLGEIVGVIADDVSGHALQGTLNGGITLGVSGLLTDAADSSATAMQFNGSTGYISIPTAGLPSGNSAWSIEGWGILSSFGGNYSLWSLGTNTTKEGVQLGILGTSGLPFLSVSGLATVSGATAVTTGTPFYLALTYDGTTLKGYCYQSGGQSGSFGSQTPGVLSITYGQALIGTFYAAGGNFWPSKLQYPGFYSSALTLTQVGNHFTAGT